MLWPSLNFNLPPEIDLGLFRHKHRIGPGKRSIDADHKRIRDAELSRAPGAKRMRAVVERRRANWR